MVLLHLAKEATALPVELREKRSSVKKDVGEYIDYEEVKEDK